MADDSLVDTRQPPHNLHAEKSILGSLMLDPNTWDEVVDVIRGEDFYKPANRIIFDAIGELRNNNEPIDILILTNLLRDRNVLPQIGGEHYLIEIVENTLAPANVGTHAKIVREKALARRVITTCSKAIEQAFEQSYENVTSFIDNVEGEIFKLNQNQNSSGLVGAMEIVRDSMEQIEELYSRKAEITGLQTGFKKLDEMTAGLQGGELIILAARPSMGKTAFSLNIALNAALRSNKTVAYFSLEMSKESVMTRLLASAAEINMGDIKVGKINDDVWPKLITVAGQLSECPLYIDDTTQASPFEIRSKCRRLKAQHGLDAIMIDYLQLMSMKKRVESREREVAEISGTLKAIAREFNVPVIALAQLNRGVEGRSDRRPMLSDLRESGSIEQDADLIAMLYRDDYYEKDNPELQGKAEVIIGKHRNGPTGTVKLRFDGKYGRFRDAEPEQGFSPRPPAPQPPVGGPPPSGKPQNFAPT